MAIRSEELNRLATGSKCTTSWDAMQGDDRRRFCAECRRDVFDFERLTPQEIRGHLEASHGKLCARLTHIGGRLSVFEPVEPFEPMRLSAPRRTSSITAAVVTAWLGIGAAHTAPIEPAALVAATPRDEALPNAPGERAAKSETRSTVGAAIRGKLTQKNGLPLSDAEVVALNILDDRETLTVTRADGTFSFENLLTAVYDVLARAPGFDVEPQYNLMLGPGEVQQVDLTAAPFEPASSLGIIVRTSTPRKQFDDSDLVVVAVVGPSVVVERQGQGSLAKVATELRIESLLKGKSPGRSVTYLHSEYLKCDPEDQAPEGFAPGTKILAYLDASEDSSGLRGGPAYESSDVSSEIQHLGTAERAAYVDRFAALSDLERTAERRGEPDPAELMEWLVASAENPLARGLATAEVRSAFEALQNLAASQKTTPELAAPDLLATVKGFREEGGTVKRSDRPLLLGASLTDRQKRRLTAALQETEGLRGVDLNLFEIVRKWDEKAAETWLAHQLRTVEPKPADEELVTWQLDDIAEKLDDNALRALTDGARDRYRGIYQLFGNDCSKADEKLREKKLATSRKDLRHQFGKAVAHRHGVPVGS
ncbi:MAG TPA: carboxypeptidase-like regulatory domain-containing protein [Thermoanaerobaculia bacterium]|jgi:hypothetical protein|nr:carboxypeptidase-like regulatory domain-containing protein [Thermoanaerobaculia bacterium]